MPLLFTDIVSAVYPCCSCWVYVDAGFSLVGRLDRLYPFSLLLMQVLDVIVFLCFVLLIAGCDSFVRRAVVDGSVKVSISFFKALIKVLLILVMTQLHIYYYYY